MGIEVSKMKKERDPVILGLQNQHRRIKNQAKTKLQ